MDDDFTLDTKKNLKQQKNRLKGKDRHDPEETRKHQIMKLHVNHDVEVDDDTHISTRVYNDICGYMRKTKRLEQGRGKHKKK
jgi:hypothetical protein